MRSVVPSDRATVPFPDHAPLNPVNGPDWACPADDESMIAAQIPAALIACPGKLKPNSFIAFSRSKLTNSPGGTSRRIEDLVSLHRSQVQITRPPLRVVVLI